MTQVPGLFARLASTGLLASEDIRKLDAVPQFKQKLLADGECILHEGDKSEDCVVVNSGFLIRRKLRDRSQILSIYEHPVPLGAQCTDASIFPRGFVAAERCGK